MKQQTFFLRLTEEGGQAIEEWRRRQRWEFRVHVCGESDSGKYPPQLLRLPPRKRTANETM